MNSALRLAACVMAVLVTGTASAAGGEEKLARNLAALLVAGRAVVSQNQPLINDAARADKGFTAAAFGAAVTAEYRTATGIDLAALDRARPEDRQLLALFQAERDVVGEAQPLINSPGTGFKGFTPAVFGRAAAQKFLAATGISMKQTSEKYRNPLNEPDAFERRTLARFAAAGWERGKGIAEAGEVGGKKVVRYVQPLYIAKGCLVCHGDPKGELDIAGRAKEGYKEGELRGAISVVVPVGP